MNIHLPDILGFTRYQGFDPSPYNPLETELQPQVLYSKVIHLPPIKKRYKMMVASLVSTVTHPHTSPRYDQFRGVEPQAMMSMMPMMMGYLAMKWTIAAAVFCHSWHEFHVDSVEDWYLMIGQHGQQYMNTCLVGQGGDSRGVFQFDTYPVLKTVDLMAINGCESRPSDPPQRRCQPYIFFVIM